MKTICRSNPDSTSCANKPRIVRMDLDEKAESYFLRAVYEACQCYTDPVDLCTAIKQCLDQKFGQMWHVVVGPEFGSDHSSKPRFLRKSLDENVEADFLYYVRQVYHNYDDPEDMCTALRTRLEDEFGPTWHVIIGDYFGSHFEHDPQGFCYITYQGLSFLMFKFG
ncbi:dynein light chain [Echinococcus multilocularis]|uniref:Dynein light chain n=1 Tax=Echinococcus multilocularis TaxID=6211 RepID=A0A087W0K1_ECHMU|nr:dynein light chain [Echinococcus multilocularis]